MVLSEILKGKEKPRLYDSIGNEVGLKEICEWWITTYPEDIFISEPKDIILARGCMERLLGMMSGNGKKKKATPNQQTL
jgi:hypothetical protein